MNFDEYDISLSLRRELQALPKFKLADLYGNCPVQAVGSLDDKHFYFRARGTFWRMEVGGDQASAFPPTWWYSKDWPSDDGFAAGWLNDEEALGCILEAAKHYYASDKARFQTQHPDYKRTILDGWSMQALTLSDVVQALGIDPRDAESLATAVGIEVPWTAPYELKRLTQSPDDE